jgi:hypothetical protein
MRPPGHRDRPGQNLKCPGSRLDLTGQATGTDRTQPYRGVPLSRCPGNRPTQAVPMADARGSTNQNSLTLAETETLIDGDPALWWTWGRSK